MNSNTYDPGGISAEYRPSESVWKIQPRRSLLLDRDLDFVQRRTGEVILRQEDRPINMLPQLTGSRSTSTVIQ